METKPGQGYLYWFEENKVSKRWFVRLYDEYWKVWEIKIENTDWDSTVWSVTMCTDDGLGHTVVGVVTTEHLIRIVQTISNPESVEKVSSISPFHIFRDGRLIINIEDPSSLYKLRERHMRRSVEFTSEQRRNLSEALKEIPILQALGILEKGDENDPGRVEERSNL